MGRVPLTCDVLAATAAFILLPTSLEHRHMFCEKKAVEQEFPANSFGLEGDCIRDLNVDQRKGGRFVGYNTNRFGGELRELHIV